MSLVEKQNLKSRMDDKSNNGGQMQLWTIYDGKIYVEENDYRIENDKAFADQFNSWLEGFKVLIKNKEFPKRL